MGRKWIWWLLVATTLAASLAAAAQQSCANGIRIEGTIADPSGAVVPGAQVQAMRGERMTSDAAGR